MYQVGCNIAWSFQTLTVIHNKSVFFFKSNALIRDNHKLLNILEFTVFHSKTLFEKDNSIKTNHVIEYSTMVRLKIKHPTKDIL